MTGRQAADSGAVGKLGKVEMLWVKAENSIATGEGRVPGLGKSRGWHCATGTQQVSWSH